MVRICRLFRIAHTCSHTKMVGEVETTPRQAKRGFSRAGRSSRGGVTAVGLSRLDRDAGEHGVKANGRGGGGDEPPPRMPDPPPHVGREPPRLIRLHE